jgi:hypothetical protein
MKLNFHDTFSEKTVILNFIITCPVGAELFCAAGWADRHDKADSRFLQSENVPDSLQFLHVVNATIYSKLLNGCS